MPGHVIYTYNKGQRCLSLLVWLLGVDYVSCTSCTAGSNGHRLLGSLLWGDATSIFWGVGPCFHAFNESRRRGSSMACLSACICYIGAVMVISHFIHCGQERRQESLLWGVLQRNCGAHKISNASKDNTSYTTCTAAMCH